MVRAAGLALLLAAASGCAYRGTAQAFDPAELTSEPGWIFVEGVPAILQEAQEDCGAAALAAVLAYWKAPADAERILLACPPKPEEGIEAGALRDFARSCGLQAFLFAGEWDDLKRELAAGRPVLVGLGKPYITGILSHYEVVTAYHQEKRLLVTVDPANGWRKNSPEGFQQEWTLAGRLTLVVSP